MRPHCRPSLGSHLLRPPLPLRQLLQLLPLQCPLPLLGSLNTTESDIFQHKLSHTPISPALSINYPIYLDSPSVSVGSLHTFCRLGPTLVVAFSWSWPLPGRLHSVVPLPHHPALYLPVSVRGPWEPWSAHSEAEARSESPEEQSNLSNPWQPGSAHHKHLGHSTALWTAGTTMRIKHHTSQHTAAPKYSNLSSQHYNKSK